MSAEPGIAKAVRREKIVMALGIAAIILFSANLFTMIARHVWPDCSTDVLLARSCPTAAIELEPAEAATLDQTVHVFVNRRNHHDGEHRLVIRRDAREAYRETAESVEADLRAEMDRLSRDIARQQRRLDADMSARQEANLKSLRLARIKALNQAQAQHIRESDSGGSQN